MAHLHLHRGQSSLLRWRQLWRHRCPPAWRPVRIHRGNHGIFDPPKAIKKRGVLSSQKNMGVQQGKYWSETNKQTLGDEQRFGVAAGTPRHVSLAKLVDPTVRFWSRNIREASSVFGAQY